MFLLIKHFNPVKWGANVQLLCINTNPYFRLFFSPLRACLNFVFEIRYTLLFRQLRLQKRSLTVSSENFVNEKWRKKSQNKVEG
jgi:hypothetical protein